MSTKKKNATTTATTSSNEPKATSSDKIAPMTLEEQREHAAAIIRETESL